MVYIANYSKAAVCTSSKRPATPIAAAKRALTPRKASLSEITLADRSHAVRSSSLAFSRNSLSNYILGRILVAAAAALPR